MVLKYAYFDDDVESKVESSLKTISSNWHFVGRFHSFVPLPEEHPIILGIAHNLWAISVYSIHIE